MRNTKLSRRSFLAALGLGTAAALLSGCAGPDSASSSGGEGPASSSSGEAEAEPFLSPEEFPGVDGSTACIPLIAQMMADTTGIPLSEAQSSVAVSTTAYAWENMGVYGSSEIELLVVYEAPDYVKEEIAAAGVELEQKPVGRDALVFIVNEENPIESLTLAQLRDIYAGRVTNWKELGGADMPISTFRLEDADEHFSEEQLGAQSALYTKFTWEFSGFRRIYWAVWAEWRSIFRLAQISPRPRGLPSRRRPLRPWRCG